MPINVYVNRMFQEYIDQISVIAQANGIPLSTEICKAVKEYIQNLNDDKELVASENIWDNFYDNASKEQLHEMSRVICGINNRIINKLCQD